MFSIPINGSYVVVVLFFVWCLVQKLYNENYFDIVVKEERGDEY